MPGGRPKGALSKTTQNLRAFLEQRGSDPKKVLLDIMDNGAKEETRLDAARTLMPYCYPKLSSVEVTGNLDVANTIGIEPAAVETIGKIISSHKK